MAIYTPSDTPNTARQDLESLAIVDVHYANEGARAACLVARRWTDSVADEAHVVSIASVSPYVPGRFFERELPCIVDVLSRVQTRLTAIIIDGYVELDDAGTPGLGAHLHAHYEGCYAVIGVAKTAYRGSDFAVKVFRGSSKHPLFVTARGIPVNDAARFVASMYGAHRIPTLLGRVDHLARGFNDDSHVDMGLHNEVKS